MAVNSVGASEWSNVVNSKPMSNEQNKKDDDEQRQMLEERIAEVENARQRCSSKYRKDHPEQFPDEESKAASIARYGQLKYLIRGLNKKLKLLESGSPSDRNTYYKMYNDKAKTAANKAEKAEQLTQMVSDTYKSAEVRLEMEKEEKAAQKKSGLKPMTPMTATEIIEINNSTSLSLERRQTDYQTLKKRVEKVEKLNREGVHEQLLRDYLNIAMHLVTIKKIIEKRKPGTKVSVNEVDRELNPGGSQQSKKEERKNGQLIWFGEIVIRHRVFEFWKDSPLSYSALALGVGSGIDSPLDIAFTSLGEEKCKIWSLPLSAKRDSDSDSDRKKSKRSRRSSKAKSSDSSDNDRKTSKRSRNTTRNR